MGEPCRSGPAGSFFFFFSYFYFNPQPLHTPRYVLQSAASPPLFACCKCLRVLRACMSEHEKPPTEGTYVVEAV